MSKQTIIYSDLKRGVFDDFDTVNSIKSEQQLINQRELMYNLYNTIPMNVPKQGEVYTLTFVGKTKDSLLFEGGFKDYVRVDNKPSELKYFKTLNVGDEVDILISRVQQGQFFISGSIALLYETKAHYALKNLREEEFLMAYVKELTPAGYNVELQYDSIILPGFMPNTLAGVNRLSNSESILGQTFPVMLEMYSNEDATFVVSRRKYLQSLIPSAIKELKCNEVVYTGLVTGTTDFGVFVEFNNCLTGMIHKTNIDPDWADRIKSIPAGFEIQFYVKEIIKDNKIILTQILRDSLWDVLEVGQTMNGKVIEYKTSGLLVSLDSETVGIVSNAELDKLNREFTDGQTVKVKINHVDRSNRKIFLSII